MKLSFPSWLSPKKSQQQSLQLQESANGKFIPGIKQLRYAFNVFPQVEQWILKGLIFLIVIGLGFQGYLYYQANSQLVADIGGSYTEGVVGTPQYINPILAYANDVDLDLTRLIYSGLLKRESGKLVLDVAKNFDISEDQKSYTFHLRNDVYFHDGDQLTSHDVLFTIAAIQDLQYKSPYYATFANVTVEIIDDYTIKISLDEPYAPFLDVLTVGILPSHIWERIPPINATLTDYNLKPIGSGPYEFEGLTKDKLGSMKTYSLKRNKRFYEEGPYIQRYTFKFYPDFQTALQALENDFVNGISFLSKEYHDKVEEMGSVTLHTLDLPQYTAIFFNPKQNSHVKNKEVRQALAHAINKEEIINEALHGEATAIHAPILPGYIGYKDDLQDFPFDLELANDLLQDAGYKYPDSNDENQEGPMYREKDGEVLTINLTTIETFENIKTAEKISAQWEQIGVLSSVQTVYPDRFQEDVLKNRNYDALIYGQIIGSDPDPLPFWHSSQTDAPGLNLSSYANRHVDTLLEDGRKTHDPIEREEKYIDFQERLIEDIPTIFLYSPTYTYVTSEDLQGFDIDRISIPADRFSNVYQWYIKTKRDFSPQ